MYNGVARSSYRRECCDDVTKLGLCYKEEKEEKKEKDNS